jgi:hypothetical protein
MRDLEQADDVVADAHIDLLPQIQMMRIERVVEIEDPGRDTPEGFNIFAAGFRETAGGLFRHLFRTGAKAGKSLIESRCRFSFFVCA